MARGGGNRNQKLAAKAAKRKAAVAEKLRTERLASSPAARIVAAAPGAIEHCLRTSEMFDAGIGHVILARRLPSQTLGCAFFLVDLFCLGVKDAYFREMADSDLDDHLERLKDSGQTLVAIDPASARKLLSGAVAFAAASGLEPAKGYRTVVKLFGDVDDASSAESFTFGRDGKAIYIPGPNDSMTRMREVERILDRHRGDDGWDVDIGPDGRAVLDRLAAILDVEAPSDDGSFLGDGEGPIIEHEGSTEPDPDPAASPTRA